MSYHKSWQEKLCHHIIATKDYKVIHVFTVLQDELTGAVFHIGEIKCICPTRASIES